MKTTIVLIALTLTQVGCLQASGGGSSAKTVAPAMDLIETPTENTEAPTEEVQQPVVITPAWQAPTSLAGAEQALRGDYYSTRDRDNFLKIDNQGHWSFQLETGRYRPITTGGNTTYIETAYTLLVSGSSVVAVLPAGSGFVFEFNLDQSPQYTPFYGPYDFNHDRMSVDFVSENCIQIRVKALNQDTYDTFCK